MHAVLLVSATLLNNNMATINNVTLLIISVGLVVGGALALAVCVMCVRIRSLSKAIGHLQGHKVSLFHL